MMDLRLQSCDDTDNILDKQNLNNVILIDIVTKEYMFSSVQFSICLRLGLVLDSID